MSPNNNWDDKKCGGNGPKMKKIIWENLVFEETRKVSWPDNKMVNQLSFHHRKYNEISEFGKVFLIRDKRQVVLTVHPKKF